MKLECYIVRDLLPSYLEGLTEEQTNADMQEHLASCRDCGKVHDQMVHEFKAPDLPDAQVDFLKGIRQRLSRKSLLGIGILVAAVVINLLMNYFFTGGANAWQLMLIQPVLLFLSYFLMDDVLANEKKTSKRYYVLLVAPLLALFIADGLFLFAFNTLKTDQFLLGIAADNVGPFIFSTLILLILILLVFCSLALQRAIRESYTYFLAVCNGLAVVSMNFALISMLRTLNNPETFLKEFFVSNLVYVEGVVVLLVIGWLLKKKREKDALIV